MKSERFNGARKGGRVRMACVAMLAFLGGIPAMAFTIDLTEARNGDTTSFPDTVTVPINILTDTYSGHSSPVSHTVYVVNTDTLVAFPSYGFTILTDGTVSGGHGADAYAQYMGPWGISAYTGNDWVSDYTWFPNGSVTFGPYTQHFAIVMDYNPSKPIPDSSPRVDVVSNFERNAWQANYINPCLNFNRTPINYASLVSFNFCGANGQAPNQPYVLPFCPCCGMAVASLDRFQAGVSISDSPVGYTPALGRDMRFQATYHQRLSNQPSTFNFSNLGPQWSFNWISYIGGGPTNSQQQATYFAPGGSQYTYSGYRQTVVQTTGASIPNEGDFVDNDAWTHATLHYRQGPERYERWLPDGTVEVFGQPVGTSPNRNFFLTKITDPQGNSTTLSYDSTAAANGNAVLTAVTDPEGGQLRFGYGSSDPLKILQVSRSSDGLASRFQYTSGQLTSITDTIGITSAFHYTSGTNFIDKMTTPYGATTFSSSDGKGYLEADMTNPLGQTERIEYQESLSTSLVAASESAPSVTGMTLANAHLNRHSSYYWNRRAMADAAAGSITTDSAGFYALAQVSHWAESSLGSIPLELSSKKRLEGRVWYNYPGQSGADLVDVQAAGTSTSPSYMARLVDSGGSTVTQSSKATYNANGMLTQSIDPLGRTTNFTYDTNAIDLLAVKQVNGGGQDTLSTMTYNSLHEPLTVTDASDQTTTMTYNTAGQMLTRTVVVGGSNQTTTLAYYSSGSTGYLHTLTGPVSGATTTYAYDSAGRISTVTDSEGYVVTTAYDSLDRPVSATYPDSTTDLTAYHNLDVDHTTDRQGRVTRNSYDAIRELVQTTDPMGRTTKYTWCTCGGLSTLTDASGHVTTWGLDGQGRVTGKTYVDGSAISYVYETNTSRLHTMTDALGSVATYAYNTDNTLSGTTYSAGSGVSSTPNVSFTYDTPYNRVLTMVDGSGTTTYSYNAVYSSGAAITGGGRLGSVSVPIASTSATVAYTYDELGRVVGRSIDGSNPVATTFDALGRVTHVTNALTPSGQDFTYAYVDETSRLASVTYPTSTELNTTYSYFGNTSSDGNPSDGDQRLSEIKNYVWGIFSNTPVSKFDYTYNAVGTIATWTQQADSSTAVVNTLSYDGADQLISAVQSGGGSASNAYNYDLAGNRLNETTGSGTTAGQFNKVNELTRLSGSTTSQTVAGHTSGAVSSVTVNAVAATLTSGTNFSANVALPAGTNIVSVVAQPATGSATTERIRFVTTGTAPTSLAYDANGNVTTDENGNNFKWDALNRLTAIIYNSGTYSGTHTEFAYDGMSRRISIVERAGTTVGSGTVSSTKLYLWVGSEIAEERASNGTTVTKRFFPQGEQQSGTAYYYTRDHLGSVREMTDSSGTIQARYDYDPYGRTTLVQGTNLSDIQYGRMYMHQPSGLYLTRNVPGISGREYDPNAGRWLNRDPIAESGGLNLYGYVGNDPIDGIDLFGLETYFTHYTGLDDGYRVDGIYVSAAVGVAALTVATAGSADAIAAALASRFPWLVPAAAAGTAVVNGLNGQPCPTGTLMPNGNPLGNPGSNPAIRELPGGLAAAQSFFNQFTKGGKVLPSSTYPGTLVQLPGGGTVGLRTVMSNSPNTAATVDVNIPNIPITKIKFN